MKFTLLIILLFINSDILPQNKEITLSGFISDSKSGEHLIGTNILLYKDTLSLKETPFRGTSTNNFGYFVIPDIPSGIYFLICRNIGYKAYIRKLEVNGTSQSVRLDINMIQENIKLEEIVVKGEKKERNEISTIDINPEVLKQIPSMTGEASLFKSLELLPGVQSMNEFSNGLYIRGGSPDQTLILVDGTVVYNPSHLGNFSSTFNADAISKIKLIKGAFPAEYGGRLSSILDIKLRSGTKERETGSFSVGALNSQLTLEGPMGKNATYMISGRKMYYDLLQNNFIKDVGVPRYNYYDFSSKVTFTTSPTDIISLEALINKDNVYSPSNENDINYNISWQNSSASFNWLKITSRYVFLNMVLSYINYDFNSTLKDQTENQTTSDYFSYSKLQDLQFKLSAEYNKYENSIFKSGFEMALHNYNLFYTNKYDARLENNLDLGNQIFATDASFYVQNESKFFNIVHSNIGVRFYYFNELKYYDIEPRISFSFDLNENTILKAAYASANQFLHLINRNDISLPTDLWYPSTKEIKPGKSDQYVTGIETYLFDREISASVEGYYKKLTNLYEFKDAPVTTSLNSIEEAFTSGKGEAYGMEFFINKFSGNFTGWIGYTLSWTKRKFAEINAGRTFYPRYDRRHDLSIVFNYNFSDAFNAGITWTYYSGQGISIPTGQYQFPKVGVNNNPFLQYDYSERNAFKLPAYHKMDLTVSYNFPWGKKKITTYISIYNLYNQKNAFAYYINYGADGKNVLKKLPCSLLFRQQV